MLDAKYRAAQARAPARPDGERRGSNPSCGLVFRLCIRRLIRDRICLSSMPQALAGSTGLTMPNLAVPEDGHTPPGNSVNSVDVVVLKMPGCTIWR